MKRFLLFLMAFGGMTPMMQQAMAENVTLHFYVPNTWAKACAYAYSGEGASSMAYLGAWGSDKSVSNDIKTVNGNKIATWTFDTGTVSASDVKVIFNDKGSNQCPGNNRPGWKVVNNGYYTTNGLLADTEFEMVAECGGKQLIRALSASRLRESNPYSLEQFSVGIKDELLPGKKGDQVRVYVRGKNNHSLQYRPLIDNTLGSSWNLALNTNLTGYVTGAYLDPTTAASSSNAIVIVKGSGVSYTLGLNLGDKIKHHKGKPNVSYGAEAHSLSLYTNKSIDELYASLYPGYKNATAKKNADLEDFYMLGNVANTSYSYEATEANKMVKNIYLNPKDNNVVDSIVYSKVVKKNKGSFGKLYMSFAPKSLMDDASRVFGSKVADALYTDHEKWNLVVRPQVQDQKDATATTGSVFVSGYRGGDNDSRCNGSQSLNPQADDARNYYIVRLNTTTSTYRIEFVDDQVISFRDRFRTYSSSLNLKLKDGYRAYAAQKFEETTAKQTGQPEGRVVLRSLKYIPHDQGVLLVADQVPASGSETFEVLTDADDSGLLTEVEENWWKNSYPNETFRNDLVEAVYGKNIENGEYTVDDKNYYHYSCRHFALNYLYNTKYYKGLQDEAVKSQLSNYAGFFRAEGNVKPGHAFLALKTDQLNHDCQFVGDINSNLDDNTAPAKLVLWFDDANETTGISEIKTNERNTDDAYYTLQGVKVAHPAKGIFIHQGKKVVLK